jgi:peptidoglycan/LPS O-acetylase OafA/YrhL
MFPENFTPVQWDSYREVSTRIRVKADAPPCRCKQPVRLALDPRVVRLIFSLFHVANLRTSKRVPELDGLRGAAILLVVIVHYFSFNPYGHASGWTQSFSVIVARTISMGWTGVDLFFVLSGFLIGGILLDARDSPHYFKTFYVRRFFRIIPIYYGWMAAYVALMAVAGPFLRAHVAAGAVPDGRHQYLVLLLFLQNFGLLGHSVIAGAWFWPTWSVAVEEQFYLVVPSVVRFLSRRALYVFLFVVIGVAPLLRLWIHHHFPVPNTGLDYSYILMPCRADAFAIGILAALFWRSAGFRAWLGVHGRMLAVLCAGSLAGVAALVHWYPAYNSLPMISVGYTWIAGFYAIILIAAIGKPAGAIARFTRMGWLREFGRVSYCFYLIHLALRLILQILVRAVAGPTGAWEEIGISIAAIALSYEFARLSWNYFEYPLLRRGHSYHYYDDVPALASVEAAHKVEVC